MAINGNNILILVDGSVVAGTKSNEAQVESDAIEVASPTNGIWAAYIPGRRNWSVTSNCLILSFTDIKRVLRVGASVSIRILGRGQSSNLIGTAIVQNCSFQFIRGNLATGSFSFKGNGPLTEE
jgi:predicted secreted protein